MAVTDLLVAEHETVLSKLAELEAAANRQDRSAVVRLLPFFENDIQHHRRKEEEVLFPAVARHIGSEGGPIACMIDEHRQEKELVRLLRRSVDGGGEPGTLAGTAGRFIGFLRLHIRKENEVLFPLAEEVLSFSEKETVFSGMLAIGPCCDVCGNRADAAREKT